MREERLAQLWQLFWRCGDHLQADASHLVVRFLAPGHPNRWMTWVALVCRRVVVADLGVEPRALRQRYEIGEAIPFLPREVPVVDPQQRLHVTIRQRRRQPHLLAKVVRMRADTECAHVNR